MNTRDVGTIPSRSRIIRFQGKPIVTKPLFCLLLITLAVSSISGERNRFLFNAGIGPGNESYRIQTSSLGYPDLDSTSSGNAYSLCARLGIGIRVCNVPLLLDNHLTWFKIDDSWRLSGFSGIGSYYAMPTIPFGVSGAVGFDWQPLLIEKSAYGFGILISPYYSVSKRLSLSLDILYGVNWRKDQISEWDLNNNERIIFGRSVDYSNFCNHVSVSVKANVKNW
jgi:hypothetical protein